MNEDDLCDTIRKDAQMKRSLIEANSKLNRLNIYLDELGELNGLSLSWNSAISEMKAIINEVQNND